MCIKGITDGNHCRVLGKLSVRSVCMRVLFICGCFNPHAQDMFYAKDLISGFNCRGKLRCKKTVPFVVI